MGMLSSIFWWWDDHTPSWNMSEQVCSVGDLSFKSIGEIHWPDSSYFTIDKFGDDTFMLISEREYSRGRTGSIGMVPNLKEGIANGDVGSLQAIPLDPSPYEW